MYNAGDAKKKEDRREVRKGEEKGERQRKTEKDRLWKKEGKTDCGKRREMGKTQDKKRAQTQFIYLEKEC